MIIVDLADGVLSANEQQLLQHPLVGGVILFSRNFVHITQLKILVTNIRNINPQLLIMIDHEGGRVWRCQDPQFFPKPPAAATFGSLYQNNPAEALDLCYNTGIAIATPLIECGIDLCLGPVLDLGWPGRSAVIGDRAFSPDAHSVIALGEAFINGLNQAGMQAVGKHFPGHGYANADSHFSITEDDRTLEELRQADLLPFTKLSNKLAGIMPAHVIYSRIKPEESAGCSVFWLQKILREECQFEGAIISDCVSMHGLKVASPDLTDPAVAGLAAASAVLFNKIRTVLAAGCDLVIAAQQEAATLTAALAALTKTSWQPSRAQQQRIHKLRGSFSRSPSAP